MSNSGYGLTIISVACLLAIVLTKTLILVKKRRENIHDPNK